MNNDKPYPRWKMVLLGALQGVAIVLLCKLLSAIFSG